MVSIRLEPFEPSRKVEVWKRKGRTTLLETMRVTTHPLDKPYTYPCSKSDVKAAFDEGSLDGATFGLLPRFGLNPRHSPRPQILGTVILVLTVREPDEFTAMLGRSSLYVYRILRDDFDRRAQMALPALMRGPMHDWLAARLDRAETEASGTVYLLVEARGPRLLLHETRYR